jgi:hypothetical protein
LRPSVRRVTVIIENHDRSLKEVSMTRNAPTLNHSRQRRMDFKILVDIENLFPGML